MRHLNQSPTLFLHSPICLSVYHSIHPSIYLSLIYTLQINGSIVSASGKKLGIPSGNLGSFDVEAREFGVVGSIEVLAAVVGKVVVIVVGMSVDVGVDLETDRVDDSNADVEVDRGVVMVTEVLCQGYLSRLRGLFSLLCLLFFSLLPLDFFSLLLRFLSLLLPLFFSLLLCPLCLSCNG